MFRMNGKGGQFRVGGGGIPVAPLPSFPRKRETGIARRGPDYNRFYSCPTARSRKASLIIITSPSKRA